ncbi:MAG: hypothetical protein IH856_24825 [Deltaproteobacteria bacterium]|nr:hypothetical protein [Deltaproteobacteria bacterium]
MASDGNEYYYFFRQKLLIALLKLTATIFYLLVSLLQPVGSQHLPSTPITAGYRDFNYGREPNAVITETKPESKLWFNDGFWWGSLFDPVSENYRIHQFDVPSQCWVNVGPDIDDRDNTLADALWDGTQLYIVSHVKKGFGGSTSSVNSARLYRYSYDSISNTYSLDAGFPVNVNNHTSESLVLTKDSTGQLWVTWTLSDRNVWINRTVGDDKSWGEPFILPAMEQQIDLDDISGILAFGDNKIGVMWSNQVERNIFFAVHIDSSADTEWEPQEAAIENSNNELVSDDHLNLSMACSGDGKTVVAVTKSSLSDLDEPKIYFLKRSPDGQWSETVFGFLRDRHTRPIVLVNSDTDTVYVLAKSGPNSDKIYIKSAHLDNPQFESGRGTLFIASEDDKDINNVTSTKQCVNSETGLLVIASDNSSRHYFHNYMTLDLPVQRTLSTSILPSGTSIRCRSESARSPIRSVCSRSSMSVSRSLRPSGWQRI